MRSYWAMKRPEWFNEVEARGMAVACAEDPRQWTDPPQELETLAEAYLYVASSREALEMALRDIARADANGWARDIAEAALVAAGLPRKAHRRRTRAAAGPPEGTDA